MFDKYRVKLKARPVSAKLILSLHLTKHVKRIAPNAYGFTMFQIHIDWK